MNAPPDLLAIVCDMLADRIAARIATPAERETYDSRHLPPRTTRRRYAELCRSGRVSDARREGRDWTCSRAAWEGARRRAPRPTTAPTAASALQPDLVARADALLAKAGLRSVRGGGR